MTRNTFNKLYKILPLISQLESLDLNSDHMFRRQKPEDDLNNFTQLLSQLMTEVDENPFNIVYFTQVEPLLKELKISMQNVDLVAFEVACAKLSALNKTRLCVWDLGISFTEVTKFIFMRQMLIQLMIELRPYISIKPNGKPHIHSKTLSCLDRTVKHQWETFYGLYINFCLSLQNSLLEPTQKALLHQARVDSFFFELLFKHITVFRDIHETSIKLSDSAINLTLTSMLLTLYENFSKYKPSLTPR